MIFYILKPNEVKIRFLAPVELEHKSNFSPILKMQNQTSEQDSQIIGEPLATIQFLQRNLLIMSCHETVSTVHNGIRGLPLSSSKIIVASRNQGWVSISAKVGLEVTF